MTRECGDCSLCCKLVPVAELNKPAATKCKHQRHSGCAVYKRRPRSCAVWFCRWLINDDTADMSRPDRCHYVIDVMPDYVTLTEPGGEPIAVRIEQIWVDPKYPDAHRDPKLREYLLRRGKQGIAGLVRYDNKAGLVIFPPNMTANHDWHEITSPLNPESEHKPSEVMDLIEQGVL